MIEAWFNQEQSQYISMVAFSALVVFITPLIKKGTHQIFVLAVWFSFITMGIVFLMFSGIAYLKNQPPHVYLPLFFGGSSLCVTFGITLFSVFHGYRKVK